MVARYVFKKWSRDKDYASCWYCDEKTLFFILNRKTREEFFCCSPCALKKHRIKRLKTLLKKYPRNYTFQQRRAILEQDSLSKKVKNGVVGGVV